MLSQTRQQEARKYREQLGLESAYVWHAGAKGSNFTLSAKTLAPTTPFLIKLPTNMPKCMMTQILGPQSPKWETWISFWILTVFSHLESEATDSRSLRKKKQRQILFFK